MDDARLASLRAELARMAEQSSALGPEAAEALTTQIVLTVVTALPDIVAAVSPDGRFLFVNRVIAGLTLDDVIGTSVYDFMPDDSAARARASIERVVATGAPDSYQALGPGPNGVEAHYRTRCLPIVGGDRVIAVALVVTDVTDTARGRAALEHSQARLQLALAASGAGLWAVDLSTQEATLDERARGVLGLDSSHGPPPAGMDHAVHPDDRARVRRAFVACVDGRAPYDIEHRILEPDGTVRWVATHGVVLQDEHGVPRQLVGTIRDVTEQRLLEEQLRQSQKLEAVGQLTAGIAHNFNNLLAIILPNIELARSEAGEAAHPFLADAERATLRAAELVQQLMTFAGKNRRVADRAVDVGAVIRSAVAICRATFDRSIQITVAIDDELPPCEIDAGELEQALLNVMINARDAVAAEERPRIRVVAEPSVPEHEAPVAPLGWIAIRIVDNGTGMNEAVRQRAIEPFFTTKEVGKGTGLGLATTYALTTGAGGQLELTSTPGAGTEVTLWLPGAAATDTPDDVDVAAARLKRVDDRPLVLVVDDEEGVRAMVKRLLERAGLRVVAVGDGSAALRFLEAEPATVMILDLSMPGVPWREVLHRARALRPDIRVLIYTGLAVEADQSGADAVLQKPVTGARLVDAVLSLLDASQESR